MTQSKYKSWTDLNRVICLEKAKQFAVNYDTDEKVWTYSRPAIYVVNS